MQTVSHSWQIVLESIVIKEAGSYLAPFRKCLEEDDMWCKIQGLLRMGKEPAELHLES